MKKDWVFIVNPIAGNDFAKNYIGTLEAMIKRYQVAADVVFTERKDHATELAANYVRQGYKYFIAVSGDGTFNEMTRPLLNNRQIITGIIPAGTGNDFIQILGFPRRFEEKDWQIFFERNIISMDVGRVNDITFVNGMGLGFDAEVAAQNYEAPCVTKKGGEHKYVWHILKVLLFYKEKRMITITGGEKTENNCFINTIAIGRRFAASFYLTPRAIANDGLLDVCAIKELSLLKRLQILLKVPKGTHLENKEVHYYQTDKLLLEFAEEVPFHVDGELYFASKFDVRVLPAALQVIYNPSGNHFFKR